MITKFSCLMNFSILQLLLFTLSLTTTSATNTTFNPTSNIIDCTICYEPVTPVQYFQSFNCTHTHIHKQCAQNWVDTMDISPTCPICRAPTLLTPAPRPPEIHDSDVFINRCRNPVHLLDYNLRMKYAIKNNDFTHAIAYFQECVFPYSDIIEFILYATEKRRWMILASLLHQREYFNFRVLQPVYQRVLKLRNVYYEAILLTILERTNLYSSNSLIEEHKACISRNDRRCVNVFLTWYNHFDVLVPVSAGLQPLLERFIQRHPLFMDDSTVLVHLSRTLISSRALGMVLLAQCHKTFHSPNYRDTFIAIIHKNRVIPATFMQQILHYTVKYWSNKELEMVLKYKHFSARDIHTEVAILQRIRGSVLNRVFSLNHNVEWIIEKLEAYAPV